MHKRSAFLFPERSLAATKLSYFNLFVFGLVNKAFFCIMLIFSETFTLLLRLISNPLPSYELLRRHWFRVNVAVVSQNSCMWLFLLNVKTVFILLPLYASYINVTVV